MMRLIAEKLSARRGEELIFADISFSLAAGEALVVTGRNGAGKSTLLRAVAGLMQLESGRCRFDADGESRPAREASHYLGHFNAMKRELSVEENLAFWQAFLGGSGKAGHPALTVEAAADRVGLAGITHLPYGYLSAGQQRRFAMAKLIVARRPVWILDEPTAALDTTADRMFEGLMADHRRAGGIVIAATHQPLALPDSQHLVMSGFAAFAGEEAVEEALS